MPEYQYTEIRLIHVDLESDYQHTVFFEDPTEQIAYFAGRAVIDLKWGDFSYQRKDNTVNVNKSYDALLKDGINYAVYQNAHFNNKWFFCFITKIEYVNPEVTRLYLETDVIQTWYFEYDLKPSFIEREHAASDAPGDNLIDEGLELGEYICNRHETSGYSDAGISAVIGVTKNPDGGRVLGAMGLNTYMGVQYYAYSLNAGTDESSALSDFISSYDEDAAADAITCLFIAPTQLVGRSTQHLIVGQKYSPNRVWINGGSGAEADFDIEFSDGKLNGYQPRNKKLLTYPYRYMLCSNNNGAAAVYKYELFYASNDKPQFMIEGVVTPGCSIRLVPMFYNGEMQNDEEGLNMGKFPICNWTSDVYTNWLTQNGVNIAVELVTGAAKIAGGAATTMFSGGLGAAVGGSTALSGVNDITSTLMQIHQQSFVPPQSKGNINSGDIITASRRNDFHFYDMTIKRQFAEIIDDYFDMFGYKVNRVKYPAWNHREAYWYLKTKAVNLTGKIPQDDLKKLKDIFNNGVTFWRPNARFRDYTQSNLIM